MGSLFRNDLNKYKNYFKESAKLLGIDVQYRYIIKRNSEKATGESSYSDYSKPIKQAVVIENGPPMVNTLKQLGWFTDTTDEQLLVDFAVDTPNLQAGCRFTICSNENEEQAKEYEIIRMSNIHLYPSCIVCLCNPILKTESTYIDSDNIQYGQQDIASDDENYSFINEEPEIKFI